ncbi:MAG: hypothetical protein ABTS22_03915, partial [Accumulibacter sp.]|uniref:hypothetical protein n=1 Tax=Accumulibacter sp. TaxID=2053492 RepID=UPI003315744C
EMRGDLRPHHAGAEDGGFLHDQLVQAVLLKVFFVPFKPCSPVLNERLNYNATAAAVNAFARKNTRKKAPDWPGLERDN